MILKSFALFLGTILANSPVAQPRADSLYFVLIFGSDDGPLRPTHTHTWATYVKATPASGGIVHLESVTISWLPADGTESALRPFRKEAGRNYSLNETLRHVCCLRERVALWGPYQTDALRYYLAVCQSRILNSGAISYRAVDSIGPRQCDASHCVHAVTATDPCLAGRTQPVYRIGRQGTEKIVKQFQAAGAFDPTFRHDWLIPILGLDGYSFERR